MPIVEPPVPLDGNGMFVSPSATIPVTFMRPESPIGHIEPHERQAAEYIVWEEYKNTVGKYPPRVAGYFVLVKIFQREIAKEVTLADGTKQAIFLSDQTRGEDKYQSMVGLVIGMGPQAYTGNNVDGSPRFPNGPWCSIGDWVICPRYEGYQLAARHADGKAYTPLLVIPDDKILGMVEDPMDVIATHLLDR